MWFLIVTLFPNTGPLGTLTGHVIALLLYSVLFFKLRIPIRSYLRPLIILCVFFSVTIFISLLVNHGQNETSIGLIRYGFVPLYWLLGLIAGIIDWKLFHGIGKKGDFLYQIAQIFVIVQLPIALLQLLGIDGLVSSFWIAEKASDWTGIVRVVGTVQNPNTLGIFTILGIIIFIKNMKQNPVGSKILIAISLLLVIITGSRTSLIALLLLPLFHVSRNQLFSKKSVYIVLSAITAIFLSYFLLLEFRESVPYMAQLLDLASGKEISSLESRFTNWEIKGALYYTAASFQILFGLGPGFFTVLDNSYYYILYNYGVISITIFGFLIFALLRTINKQSNKIAKRSLFVLIVCGLVLDSMISFLFMTAIFYFVGFYSRSFVKKNNPVKYIKV